MTSQSLHLEMKSIPMFDQIQNVVATEEALDQIDAMMRQEATTYHCTDYLSASREDTPTRLNGDTTKLEGSVIVTVDTPSRCEAVDAECRRRMCEWCYEVLEYFGFSRETLAIAMSYLDRFLGTKVGKSYLKTQATYQLAAITSLHIAIKTHETMELDVGLVVQLSRSRYSSSRILETEEIILNALRWRMCPPTPLAFVQKLLLLLPQCIDEGTKQTLMDVARYQTELAVMDQKLVGQGASTIAYASVLNALEGVDMSRQGFPKSAYLQTLASGIGMKRRSKCVREVRGRLLEHLTGIVNSTDDSASGASNSDRDETQTAEKKAKMTEPRSLSSSSRSSSPVCIDRVR